MTPPPPPIQHPSSPSRRPSHPLSLLHSPFSFLFSPLSLLLLALALNLHDLAGDSLWGDEIFTAIFAGQSPADLIRWTTNDIHPPLYYLLAGAFTHVTVPLGFTNLPTLTSDWLWRFPSVIFTVLTIAITYRLARHVAGVVGQGSSAKYEGANALTGIQTMPFIAAFLLCLAPIVIKYGQEARMHALFMCLSVLSTWLLLRALTRPHRWIRWLVFALATTANLYTMYFGFLILAAQGCLVLLGVRGQGLGVRGQGLEGRVVGSGIASNKVAGIFSSPFPPFRIPSPRLASLRPPLSSLLSFLFACLLSFLLYLPWWPVLFTILRKRATVGAIEGGVGDPVNFMRGVVQALGPSPEPVAWIFLGLFIIGLALLARRYWPLAAFAALWLALPTALPIVLGDPRALQFRYAFVLPIYLTVVALAVGALNVSGFKRANVPIYVLWLLGTVSFIATLGVYAQTKPNWRQAATYLDTHAAPADIVLVGPLWDEGRFIGYYYHGQAQLLTPAAMVTNIQQHAETLRQYGGRVWAVNRFAPSESPALKNIKFPGVVVSEPQLTVYEPALLTQAALDLAHQAIDAAYPWAAEAEVQGVLNPDPRTAKAAALRAWADTLVAAGRSEQALAPYQTAVDIFPGWVDGLLALAETQEKVGNTQAAAKTYREAVKFNLKWQGPPAAAAAALVETGQWSQALEKYHQIIEP